MSRISGWRGSAYGGARLRAADLRGTVVISLASLLVATLLPPTAGAAEAACTVLNPAAGSGNPAVAQGYEEIAAEADAAGEPVVPQLVESVGLLFGHLVQRLEQAIASSAGIPFAGERLAEAVGPAVEKMERFRSDVRDVIQLALEENPGSGASEVDVLHGALYLALGPGLAGRADLSPGVRAALAPIEPALQHLGLGVLKDTDGDGRIAPRDVLMQHCAGDGSQQWVQVNVSLGQHLFVSTPGFDLALPGEFGEVVPSFDMELASAAGIGFEIDWDFDFGFGLSNLDGGNRAYITAGAPNGAPADEPELDFAVEVTPSATADPTASELKARAAVGLLQAEITDNVAPDVRVTAPSPIATAANYSGAFDIVVDAGSPRRVTYSSDGGETIATFILGLNAAIIDAFDTPLPPVAATLDFPFTSSGDVRPYLQLEAREPSVRHLRIDGGEEYGFRPSQSDDRIDDALGFAPRTSIGSCSGHTVRGVRPLPERLVRDVDMLLKVGDASPIPLTLPQRMFGDLRGREEVAAAVNDRLEGLVAARTTFAGRVRAELDGDTLRFVSTGPGCAPRLQVIHADRDRSRVTVHATVDIVDPDKADGDPHDPADQRTHRRLYLSDLRGSGAGAFAHEVTADARIRLHVDANTDHLTDLIAQQTGANANAMTLPSVSFDLEIDAGMDPGESFQLDRLRFDHIALDVGGFMRSVATPMAGVVGDSLKPVFSVVSTVPGQTRNALTERIPVISDIVDERVSLKKILDQAGIGQPLDALLRVAHEVVNFEQLARDLAGRGEVVFGCVDVRLSRPMRRKPLPCEVATIVDRAADLDIDLNIDLPEFKIDGYADAKALTSNDFSVFTFDLLRLDSLVNMVIGEPVDVVSFGLPRLDVDAGTKFGFDWEILEFHVGASLSLDANLRIVYDTSGIAGIVDALRAGAEPDYALLLDGFHVKDSGPSAGNPHGYEAGFGFGFEGGAKVDVLIGSAEGNVDIDGDVGLELLDLDDDGKLRYREILAVTNEFRNPENTFCLFDILAHFGVKVSGKATLFGETIAEGSMGLSSGTISLQDLLDAAFDKCPRVIQAAKTKSMVLASPARQGDQAVLRVHTGPLAARRLALDTDDADATDGLRIAVSSVAGGVQVRVGDPRSSSPLGGSGATQTFPGTFSKVVVTGSEFADTIDASGLTGPALEAHGNGGNDKMTGTLGGNDILTGGPGNDELVGHGGNDRLSGDAGADRLDGGAGNDTIEGGGEADTLLGSLGVDTITGAGGNDTIDGGDDPDTIDAGPGNDTVDGSSGDDDIAGGLGDDVLRGGIGVDTIAGGAGEDSVDGGAGADTINGELGDDSLEGGPDADSIFGGLGYDTLSGGDGDDVLSGDGGDDAIRGGPGNDTASGGSGVDEISGDVGDDTLRGEGSSDNLIGGPGADSMYGGDGDETLTIEPGDRLAQGDAGTDVLVVAAGGGAHVMTVKANTVEHAVAGATTYGLLESIRVVLPDGGGTLTVDSTEVPLHVQSGPNGTRVTIVEAFAPVEVDASTGADELHVRHVRSTVTFHANDGANKVTVDDASAEISFISGNGNDTAVVNQVREPITIKAGAGNNTLDVFDGTGAITYGGGAGIDITTIHQARAEVTLDAGDGANRLTIGDTQAPISYASGNGADNALVRQAQAPIALGLGDGANVLTVEDAQNALTLDAGENGDTIDIRQTRGLLTLRSGDGNDRMTVTDAHAGVYLDGGPGADEVVVHQARGAITFDGGSGANSMTIHDTRAPVSFTATDGHDSLLVHTTGAAVSARFGNGGSATTVENANASLTLEGGADADTLTVRNAWQPISFDGKGGDDAVTLHESASTLSLTGAGGRDRLLVDQSTDRNGLTMTTSPTTITRAGATWITHDGLESIELRTGSGSDKFAVNRTTPGGQVKVVSAGGDDLLRLVEADPTSVTTFDASEGDDRLRIDAPTTIGRVFFLGDNGTDRVEVDVDVDPHVVKDSSFDGLQPPRGVEELLVDNSDYNGGAKWNVVRDTVFVGGSSEPLIQGENVRVVRVMGGSSANDELQIGDPDSGPVSVPQTVSVDDDAVEVEDGFNVMKFVGPTDSAENATDATFLGVSERLASVGPGGVAVYETDDAEGLLYGGGRPIENQSIDPDPPPFETEVIDSDGDYVLIGRPPVLSLYRRSGLGWTLVREYAPGAPGSPTASWRYGELAAVSAEGDVVAFSVHKPGSVVEIWLHKATTGAEIRDPMTFPVEAEVPVRFGRRNERWIPWGLDVSAYWVGDTKISDESRLVIGFRNARDDCLAYTASAASDESCFGFVRSYTSNDRDGPFSRFSQFGQEQARHPTSNLFGSPVKIAGKWLAIGDGDSEWEFRSGQSQPQRRGSLRLLWFVNLEQLSRGNMCVWQSSAELDGDDHWNSLTNEYQEQRRASGAYRAQDALRVDMEGPIGRPGTSGHGTLAIVGIPALRWLSHPDGDDIYPAHEPRVLFYWLSGHEEDCPSGTGVGRRGVDKKLTAASDFESRRFEPDYGGGVAIDRGRVVVGSNDRARVYVQNSAGCRWSANPHGGFSRPPCGFSPDPALEERWIQDELLDRSSTGATPNMRVGVTTGTTLFASGTRDVRAHTDVTSGASGVEVDFDWEHVHKHDGSPNCVPGHPDHVCELKIILNAIYVARPSHDSIAVLAPGPCEGWDGVQCLRTLEEHWPGSSVNDYPDPPLWGVSALKRTGHRLYAWTRDGIARFTRSDDGRLTPLNTCPQLGDCTEALQPYSVVTGAPAKILNAGRYIYGVFPDSNHLVTWRIEDDESLTQLRADVCCTKPVSVSLSADESYFYISDASESAIHIWRRDITTGLPACASGACTSPRDEPVQIVRNGADRVRGMGGVTDVAEVPALAGADAGKFVVATGGDDDALVGFMRDPATGKLTFRQRIRNVLGETGMTNPVRVFFDNDGGRIYVASRGDTDGRGGLAAFSLDLDVPPPQRYETRHSGFETLTIATGAGDDTIALGDPSAPKLNVRSGGGSDDVDYVKTKATTTDVQLGDGDDLFTVRSTAGSALKISGDKGDDTVNVVQTDAGAKPDIDLGEGEDTARFSLPRLGSDVTLHGQNPTAAPGDTLVVEHHNRDAVVFKDRAGTAQPLSAPPNDGTVTGSGTVDYSSMEHFDVHVPPRAEAGPGYTITEGQSVTLTAAPPAAGRTPAHLWDVDGDGFFGDVEGQTVTVSWNELRALGIDDDGVYPIGLHVDDGDLGNDTDTTTLTVINAAPAFGMRSAPSTPEGVPYVLQLSSDDPGADAVDGWRIDWGDGSPVQFIEGDPDVIDHTYVSQGNYVIQTLSVDDEDGRHDSSPLSAGPCRTTSSQQVCQLVVTDVPVDGPDDPPGTPADPDPVPEPPTEPSDHEASIDGPAVVAEAGTIEVQLAAPAGADEWTISWGDGAVQTLPGTATTATHTYADGPALATVNAEARVGTTIVPVDEPLVLAVTNVPPALTLAGPPVADEGPYELALSSTDIGQDAVFSWTIDWGDGTLEEVVGAAPVVRHAYDGPVNPTIHVTATDEDGSYETSREVEIRNVAPSITGTRVETVGGVEGDGVAVVAEATDPGPEPVVYAFDFDRDGTYEIQSDTGRAIYAFADDGVYDVGVQVRDDDGGVSTGTIAVPVGNVAPTPALRIDGLRTREADQAVVIDEGTLVRADLQVLDPGDDTLANYVIDWGDGTNEIVSDPTRPVPHAYADAGPSGDVLLVEASELTDEDGTHSTSDAGHVQVRNVAPTVSVSARTRISDGEEFVIEVGRPRDPGDDTVTSWEVRWGDGTTDTFQGSPDDDVVTHQYAKRGSYVYGVFLTDEDGTHLSDARRVSIVTGPQTYILSGPSEFVSVTTATFRFGASLESTFRCRLDDREAEPCKSPVTYSDLEEGEHRFAVVAYDTRGQADPTPATRKWTIDLTPPEVEITSPAPGEINVAGNTILSWDQEPLFIGSVRIPIRADASDDNGVKRVRVYVDGEPVCDLDAGPFECSWTPPLLGRHVITVDATDAAGNTTRRERTILVVAGGAESA